jgi:hypothetical protein
MRTARGSGLTSVARAVRCSSRKTRISACIREKNSRLLHPRGLWASKMAASQEGLLTAWENLFYDDGVLMVINIS